MAHYLQSANRSFALIDGQGPAAFFGRFPRFGTLISLNRRHPETANLDFAMRHDWNSLLGDASHSAPTSSGARRPWEWPKSAAGMDTDGLQLQDVLNASQSHLVREFSTELYPPSAVASEYMASFASRRGWGRESPPSPAASQRAFFGWRVVRLARAEGSDCPALAQQLGARFALQMQHAAHPGEAGSSVVMLARFVVVATGLSKEVVAPVHGNLSLLDTYVTAPVDPMAYSGQRVLVIGRGNAAFEVASAAMQSAASVHIMGRQRSRVRLSWETHYPGDVRMIHAQLLETYLLKSGDGMLEGDAAMLEISRGAHGGISVAARHDESEDYDDALGPSDTLWEDTPGGSGEQGAGGVLSEASSRWETGKVTWIPEVVDHPPGPEYDQGRCGVSCWSRREYDRVVSCIGWTFDDSWIDESARPARSAIGKYPAVTSRYESVNVPGMFFAGGLAHSLDWKSSAGGFIHGFRYTVRALHRMLEADEELDANHESSGSVIEEAEAGAAMSPSEPLASAGVRPAVEPRPTPRTAWPTAVLHGLGTAATALFNRTVTSSGLYQMFGSLTDVLVLPPFWAVPNASQATKLGETRVEPIKRNFAGQPARGMSWNVAASAATLDAAWPRAAFLHLREVPIAAAGRLARQAALTAWTTAEHSAVWRSPEFAKGREDFDATLVAPKARMAPLSQLLRAARNQAIQAASMAFATEESDDTAGSKFARAKYQPAPAVPLLEEESRLDRLWRAAAMAAAARGAAPAPPPPPAGGTGTSNAAAAAAMSSKCGPSARAPVVCYLTLSLEYGKPDSDTHQDAFALDRAVENPGSSSQSQFLHPVVRLWAAGDRDPVELLERRLGGLRTTPCDMALPDVLSQEGTDLETLVRDLQEEEFACKSQAGPWRRLRSPLGAANPEWESHTVEDFLAEFDQPYHLEVLANAIKQGLWPGA
ncbi:hypothetical protein FNF29_03992 [Cafeteria roenbergensis]|uniref:Uncharacterized protein n=2 Tax=Cafeteria roenbergensis TaxID=33653 RepID=A0A5A8CHF8_CAFRO|nr:hypothetical protein FNF29_03992 [Cafeteria roenbergensis]KAA0167868.1 hypothetical protein FNF31_00803 [Cafeteria roenbergensis]|eukprot:KAA0152426.1 hypothetical protein FNF29_03992 [Cafeteria roenbergensis]